MAVKWGFFMNNEEADNVSYIIHKSADVNDTWLVTGVITNWLFYVTHEAISLTLHLNNNLNKLATVMYVIKNNSNVCTPRKIDDEQK